MLKTRRKGSGNGGGSGELKRLRARLAEAEETLEAIRKGEVDAITVEGPHGRQIFTLQSADLPYRTLVERMNEGAASMNGEGVILFCNERLAEMLGTRPEKLIGRSIGDLVVSTEKEAMGQLLARGLGDEARGEVSLQSDEGKIVPALVSLKATPGEVLEEAGVCLIATDLGERKRHEEESRIREESLRLALKAGHSGTFDWEFERNVVRWSPESEEVYGLPVGGFSGHYEDWEPLVLPEDLEIPRTDIREALRSGEYSSEFRIRRRNDGAIRWVHARGKVFFDDAGQPIRMVGTNTDITERKQGEEASRASRARLESVLDSLPVMVCLLTPDHDVAFANQAFQKQFGDCTGRKCYECRFRNGQPCEFCETFRVLETKAAHDWEFTTPDGRRIHAFDSPLTDADGSELILKMDLDVTEQRGAEQALRMVWQYTRNLIEASLDPLATINTEGVIMDVNEATEAVTGVAREKLIGSEFSNYFTEPEKAHEGYRRAFAEGSVRDYPLAIRHTSGRVTEVLYNASVYRNEAGEVQGIFAAARDITERKRAEKKLHQQAALLDLAHDAIILRDLDGRIAFWSRGASDTYGFSVEEAVDHISQDLLQTVFPTPLEEIQQWIAKAREWEGELRHTRKDGTEIAVASRWSLLRDEEGGPAAIMEINRDVTFRKRAEEEARAAARYARNLIEASLDPLVTISSEGKITDVNLATEAATGVSREELIGSDFCDYFTEPEKARQGYQQAFEQGTVRDYPLVIRHTSGRTREVLYNASVYRDESGEVQGVFAAARDITERKRFEEELRMGRERLALALKAGHSGTFEWEIQNNINRWSPEIEELYGVPTGQFGGTYENWESLVLPEDLEIARTAIRESLASGDFNSEWRIRRQNDGEVRCMGARAKVLFDESGRPARMIGTNTDITERKRAEEALEQKAAELARSNEELAQFAYVASHDLQEPLRKIVAFGDRLAAHSAPELDEQGRDYLERMQNAAKRMAQLIESLLELSRVTTKGAEFAVVDLNAVLSEVLTDLEVRIQQTQGRVEVGALPTVMADRSQMRQLFQNLIGNALKFHREDVPPVIQISGQQKRGAWEIHVTDNGIGFDEKYTDRIFRPFQRLHGKNVFEGSGMGLAICSKIMARHAGQITAHSQPGKGSDFVLTLPTRSKTREARAT